MVKQLETIQVMAAKKAPGCSSTTSSKVLRAELGMCPLKNKSTRKNVEMAIYSEEHSKKEVASHS